MCRCSVYLYCNYPTADVCLTGRQSRLETVRDTASSSLTLSRRNSPGWNVWCWQTRTRLYPPTPESTAVLRYCDPSTRNVTLWRTSSERQSHMTEDFLLFDIPWRPTLTFVDICMRGCGLNIASKQGRHMGGCVYYTKRRTSDVWMCVLTGGRQARRVAMAPCVCPSLIPLNCHFNWSPRPPCRGFYRGSWFYVQAEVRKIKLGVNWYMFVFLLWCVFK